jgi:hypothetical protein
LVIAFAAGHEYPKQLLQNKSHRICLFRSFGMVALMFCEFIKYVGASFDSRATRTVEFVLEHDSQWHKITGMGSGITADSRKNSTINL